MILTEEEHLKNIAKIIKEFAKKYKLLLSYTSIKGNVQITSHGRLKISSHDAFDEYTLYQVKEIQGNLYENIRKYMEEQNIQKLLYIDVQYHSWAVSNIVLHFRTQYKFSW